MHVWPLWLIPYPFASPQFHKESVGAMEINTIRSMVVEALLHESTLEDDFDEGFEPSMGYTPSQSQGSQTQSQSQSRSPSAASFEHTATPNSPDV